MNGMQIEEMLELFNVEKRALQEEFERKVNEISRQYELKLIQNATGKASKKSI
jgi:hypothetical protein